MRLKRSTTPNSPLTRYPRVASELPDSQEAASNIDMSFQTPISAASERASPRCNAREGSPQHCDDLTKIENELVPGSDPCPSDQLDRSAENRRYSEVMSELEDVR